jgi:hypothetical protein
MVKIVKYHMMALIQVETCVTMLFNGFYVHCLLKDLLAFLELFISPTINFLNIAYVSTF